MGDSGQRGLGWFRVLVVGHAVSAYGSFVNFVAINLFAYQLTGSALQTGLFMALRLATSFVTGLVAGHLVTRHSRKLLMVGSDLGQAAGLTVLALAPASRQEALLYALAVVLGVGRTLSTVALRSSVPEMVGPELRVRANGLLMTGRSLAMVTGYASAGLMVATLDYRTVFLVDAASFLVSATVLAALPLTMRAAGSGGVAAASGPGLRRSLLVGGAVLWAAPLLGAMVLIRFVDAFGSASHNVGLPVLASTQTLMSAASMMSLFWASWAVGTLLVSQVVVRVVREEARLTERAFAAATVSMSVFFVVTFTGAPTAVFVVAAFLAGVSDGFAEIAYTTRLQAVPDDRRGLVFGLSAVAESSGFGIGMVVSAVLLESLSPLTVVSVLHGAAFAVAVTFLVVLLVRHRRRARPAAVPV
ncbi:MAG TPA: MFS transporter [Pseudonocardiaceae bacterium]